VREPAGYSGVAFNPATASENRIHSDEVARQYGFRGGLVPGVTTYAYLVEPAIRCFGLDWLSRGEASVVLRKPLYEDVAFEVVVSREGSGYRAAVVDADAVVCAEGSFSLPERAGDPPAQRGDPPAPRRDARPEATRAAVEELRAKGLGAFEIAWKGVGELARYHADLADMPDLVRPDRDGFASPAFTLGLANWVLSANLRLGPWIHLESRVRHFAPLALGRSVRVEAEIADCFERRGHEFVDLDVAAYGEGGAPLLRAFHRAIYRLRPAPP
jgi:acyl dehydratase